MDELEKILRRHRISGHANESDVACHCNAQWMTNDEYEAHRAQAILDAGYNKPRTISSVEELDALPAGTVIRIMQKMNLEKYSDGWYTTVLEDKFTPYQIWLPASVLFEPDADGAA